MPAVHNFICCGSVDVVTVSLSALQTLWSFQTSCHPVQWRSQASAWGF